LTIFLAEFRILCYNSLIGELFMEAAERVTTEYILGNNGHKTKFIAKSDFGRELVRLRNKAVKNGMKCYSVDEIMDAMHDGRAGGEGIGKLWPAK
jgi:hypothetical protein